MSNEPIQSISELDLPEDRSITHWAEFAHAGLEHSFRRAMLPRDRWHSTMFIAIGTAICLIFAYTDYRMFGSSPEFWWLATLRVVQIGTSVACMLAIRGTSVKRYDLLINLWLIVMTAGLLIILKNRPSDYFSLVRFDLILLCAIYVAFVTRLQTQVLLGLGVSAVFCAGFLVRQDLPTLTFLAMMTAVVCVNLGGYLLAWRLHALDRRQFVSMRVERNLGVEMQRLAHTDSLTGIANRRDFMSHSRAELERHRRHNRPFCVLLLDLDHFKQVNDRFGHDVGDEVLQRFARILESEIRTLDVAARLGGEEFGILLPETGPEPAMNVADRIRGRTRALRFGDDKEGRCTVSIGVSSVLDTDETVDQILSRADRALYGSKSDGRDRVVLAENPVALDRTQAG